MSAKMMRPTHAQRDRRRRGCAYLRIGEKIAGGYVAWPLPFDEVERPIPLLSVVFMPKNERTPLGRPLWETGYRRYPAAGTEGVYARFGASHRSASPTSSPFLAA